MKSNRVIKLIGDIKKEKSIEVRGTTGSVVLKRRIEGSIWKCDI